MELLAYIQEEFINADDTALISEMPETFSEIFPTWFKKFTTNSAKLSLNVLLTGTTLLIGLGSTLNALAAEAPSSDMKYVQSLLAKNGFDPGAIDGVSGASTKNAILRAQKAFGLTPDGVVGSRTIAALEDGKAVDAITTKVDIADTTVAVGETTTRASSTVMNLQKLLADRGFYNGAVDGIMGSQTRNAIIAAQKAYNLTVDGVAGSQTLAALESDGAKSATTTISSTTTNTKSAEVSNLQELLSKRGFYNGAVDGIMGPQTRTAIVAAQKSYGLVTDGVAGTQTITVLESGASPVSIAAKNSETLSSNVIAKTSDKDVVVLQQLLAKRGFYNGAVDGVKGAQTNAAIAAAQKNYGLTADGIAGAQTMAALQTDAKPSVVAPKSNTSNQAANTVIPATIDGGVANLQNLLTDRGFYTGPITGFLGTRTRDAIIAAQKAYGLTADGVAGAKTIAALESGAAPKQPIAATNVTPTIRVEPKPQVTPQSTPQPQAAVTPQPQPTIQVTPIPQQTQPQAAVTPQPTIKATPIPQPTATAKPTTQPSTSTGNVQVSELQRLLAQRGFYTGKVDGVLSGETRNAIIRAQNFYTISPADGSPSNKLIDSLSKDTFISEGN
jgi:peptidoglycan hydrolase-like protein with peptidoglycan-binding domain